MAKNFNNGRDSPSFDGRKLFVMPDNHKGIYNAEDVIIIDSSDSDLDGSNDIKPKKLHVAKKSSISKRVIKPRMKNICIFDANTNNDKDQVEFVSLPGSNRDNTGDSAFNGETKEDLVGSKTKAKKLNESWCIHHLEHQACSSTFDNESRNIQDYINDASTNIHTSRKRKNEEQYTFPMGFDIEMSISRAKQETEVCNIDPMIVHDRVLVLCRIVAQLLDELDGRLLLLKADETNLLSNQGDQLRKSMAVLTKKFDDITAKLERTPLTESVNTELHSVTESVNTELHSVTESVNTELHSVTESVNTELHSVTESVNTELHSVTESVNTELHSVTESVNTELHSVTESVNTELHSVTESVNPELHSVTEFNTGNFDPDSNIDNVSMKSHALPNVKAFEEKAPAALEKKQDLIVNSLQDLQRSLVHKPSKEVKAEDPQELTVKLGTHQQHSLAWLMWREKQKPAGGVLAFDIGLGKALTMISLIIATTAKKKSKGMADKENDEEWVDSKTPLRHKGGTLVVCPAPLVSKWNEEISNKCKKRMLSVQVYHGNKKLREKESERLAKYDVVITTYKVLNYECKATSPLYQIHWERVTLDKARIMLDYQNRTSKSVGGLIASKRWVLIDTPIQNNSMEFYSILKFLQFSPFDDLQAWKDCVNNRTADGRQRLETLMTTLILCKTKEELEAKGELKCLPEKLIEEVVVNFNSEEKLLYERGFSYARSVVGSFVAERLKNDPIYKLDKNSQFTKVQDRLLSLYCDIKAREIPVVLLRLRQLCDHPSLIYSELDQELIKHSEIMELKNLDQNVCSHINSITTTNEREIGVDPRVATNILTSSNPLFQSDCISSKMKKVLRTVKKILRKNDKLIIVSQWMSMLKLVASYLSSIEGATFCTIKENATIKDRQPVIDLFNAVDRNPKILLLSLTASGVGLNLVGGNHLLLIDGHWNPQFEVQAQDWIYRLGQKKKIFIYKFICKDTIEQQVQILQEKKLEIARNVPIGEKDFAVEELTFNDLKYLFSL